MTTITIYRSNKDGYKKFTCKGHAFFDESGSDIVCASISTIVIATINGIDEIVHDEIKLKDDEKSGFIECVFPSGLCEKSEVLIDSMILTLQEIEKQYRKNVRLIFKEV